MKYVVITLQEKNQMVLFPDAMNHSTMWGCVNANYPDAKLVSAGKLYIEPTDADPSIYYLSVVLGSTTLDINIKSQAKHREHYLIAYPLIGDRIEFKADELNVFSSKLPLVMERRKGGNGTLKLTYLPVADGICPSVRVELTGLDDLAQFFLWRGLHQL